MIYHKWTDADRATASARYLAGDDVADIAAAIGTTVQSLRQNFTLAGVNKGRDTCTVCRTPIVQPEVGRKRVYCSMACTNLLNSAYATNAYIDGRNFTHCVNCNARLIPPWSAKKKWCSRGCSQQGWYQSVIRDRKKRARHYDIVKLSKERRLALGYLSDVEFDWLYTLRVDGNAPDYWVQKLREKLMIRSKKDLIKYSRAIRVFV